MKRPNTINYRNWRNEVLKRDSNLCQHCKIKGKKLHAHHIVEWDKDESLRYELNNGLTLCASCHNKHHFLGKETIRKGRKVNEKTAERLRSYNFGRSAWNKGKPWSAEAKEKMRKAKLGKKISDETKLKMSNAQKLIIHSEERNEKISAAKKGKKFSTEHCAKLSKARKGKQAWNKGISMKESTKILQSKRYKGKSWAFNKETGKRQWID